MIPNILISSHGSKRRHLQKTTIDYFLTSRKVSRITIPPKTRRNLQLRSGCLRRRKSRTTDRRECRNEKKSGNDLKKKLVQQLYRNIVHDKFRSSRWDRM